MSAYAHSQGYSQRRTIVLFAIIGFHLLLIYGFANNLVPKIKELIAPPIETTIIKEEKRKEELPPPPPPEMEHPPVQVVAPEINITVSADTPPPPITSVTTSPITVVRPPPPRPVIVPKTPITPTYMPDVNDFYPETSRKAGEEGSPSVSLCLDEKGKLVSTEMAKSSGFPLLDEAAVRVVKAMRFKAATEAGGKSIASCAKLPVKFVISQK